MTTVSLITPTLKYISERTIQSVQNQTDKDFEWLIVYDNRNVPEEVYFPSSIQTKALSLNANYGPSVARNVAMQVSDGDIICYLDSDDELEPNRIENLKFAFTEKPNIEIVLSSYYIIQGSVKQLYSPYSLFEVGKYDLFQTLKRQNIIIPLGLAHTRGVWYSVGGFQRGIVCGEDGIFLRRAVEKLCRQNVLIDPNIAGTYYVNQSGQSRTQQRFEMGGFAFDAGNPEGSHGQYLDENWYNTYNSVELFE